MTNRQHEPRARTAAGPRRRDAIRSIAALALAALLTAPTPGLAQQPAASKPTLKTLKAPIPASEYRTPYRPNHEGIVTHTYTVAEEERRYHVYAPVSPIPRARKPTILLLHGANRSGVSMVDMWRGVAEKHDVILIGPDSKDGTWHLLNDGPEFLNALFANVAARYPIDRKRVYLFGHSAGGTFAIYLGLIGSKGFAAAALHAGKFRTPAHYEILADIRRKIPFAFFVGSRDQRFSVRDVKSSANAIAKAGHEVEVYVVTGHTHWYYDVAGFINEHAWQFFKKHRLP